MKEGEAKMKFIDLFSGIGGFRLGMEMAGHECAGHCELDKFAEKSYRAMHEVKEGEWHAADIRAVRVCDIPKADAWCFGFPCQDISVAGHQKGFKGRRSSLFFAVTGLLRQEDEESRPKHLLIENVKNLLSVNRGYDFARLLIEMDEIGYDAEWEVLNSKDFGVPQNRERVFIVGHLRGRRTGKVFPLGNAATENTCRQVAGGSQGMRVYDPAGTSVTLSGSGGGLGANTGLYATGARFIDMNPGGKLTGTARTLQARYYKGASGNYGGGSGVAAITAGRLGPHQTDLVQSPEGAARTLKATDYKNPQKVAVPVLTPGRAEKRQNGRRFKEDGEPMFTLTGQDRHGVTDGIRIRKLTPRECFRLQGFPDEYFDRAAAVCSDSQLYKQAGNSVTVNVVYEIARRLG